MKTYTIYLSLFLFSFLSVRASIVDTISVFSEKMQREIKNVVIVPDGYDDLQPLPVLYLLHGHGGNYATWVDRTKKSLLQDVDRGLDMIIVCPDGQDSWYWDSPLDPNSQFETYISQELVSYIDSNYKTIPSSAKRAITGFSMGGHGALWLAIHHPDVFGACGSLSGGVDLRPFPKSWNLTQHLGTWTENKERWGDYTVMTKVDKLLKANGKTPQMIIDCGTEDFFFEVNQKFHAELASRKIAHEYITRPGQHNHIYWNNAIDYQLLFFSKFFKSSPDTSSQ